MTDTDPAPLLQPAKRHTFIQFNSDWHASLADATAAFVFTRAIVLAAALAAPFVLPERIYTDLPAGVPLHTGLPWALDALVRWDGFHNLSVAQAGYHVGATSWETNTPSLPLYPLLMWLVGGWAGTAGLVIAGLLISHVCFFAALVFLHRIAATEFGRAVARRAVLYLGVFPTSLFFSSLYGEALFVLLVLAFFFALDRQAWALAGLLGGLAAVTRVPGAALAAVLVWEAVRLYGRSPAKLMPPLRALAIFALVMLPMFAVYWIQVGDPISYVTAHQIWGRKFGTPLDQFTLTWEILSQPGQTPNFGLLFPLALVAQFAAAGWQATRTQRSSHAVWFWLYFFIILASPANTPFMSVSRFLLGSFPAFIVLAQWGRNPVLHHGYVVAAALLLCLSTVVFVQWYWVA